MTFRESLLAESAKVGKLNQYAMRKQMSPALGLCLSMADNAIKAAVFIVHSDSPKEDAFRLDRSAIVRQFIDYINALPIGKNP